MISISKTFVFNSTNNLNVLNNASKHSWQFSLKFKNILNVELMSNWNMQKILTIFINTSLKNIEPKRRGKCRSISVQYQTIQFRRDNWLLQSIYQLWDTIVQDTRSHVKYHSITSDVCGKYMYEKFNEIADDTRRMFLKVISLFQWTFNIQ